MRTILVVDDEFDLLEAIRLALSGGDYQVIACSDPAEALRAAAERGPDLVLTDLMMPRMDGYELILGLRGQERTQDTPIVLMSSTTPLARQQDIGWDDFLKKPFTIDELESAVAANLRG